MLSFTFSNKDKSFSFPYKVISLHCVIKLSFTLGFVQLCKCVGMISGDSAHLGFNEYHRLRTGHQATAEEKAPSFQLQGGSVVVANKPVSHKQHLVSLHPC